MGWSNQRQEVALALIPKFSSVLSLFGSTWIIIEVLTDKSGPRPKWNHPYHRLLFAMSIYDVFESVWNFFSTWPLPAGTEGVAWAVGNTATCTAQGFFLTLSVAVPIYNAMLSLYYVLVIRYKYSDETLRNWVEPTMHLVAGGWAFFTALYAACTGLINNANLWCWIAPLPGDCLDSRRYGEEGNCVRGDNAWIYRWAFYFAPLWFCIFLASVFTYMVYSYVKELDKSSLKYRRPEHRFSYLNTSLPSEHLKALSGNEPGGEKMEKASLAVKRHVSFANLPPEAEREQAINSVAAIEDMGEPLGSDDPPAETAKMPEGGNGNSIPSSGTASPDQLLVENNPQSSEGARTERRSSGLSEAKSRASIRKTMVRWQSTRQESNREYASNYKRTIEVYHQALWYVGTFYITHVWSTTNRIIQFLFNGNSFFPLIFAHAWFDPLQGFLNYLVYQRPRFMKLRKKYPSIGRTGAMWRMLRFTYLPDPEHWKDDEVTNSIGSGNSGSRQSGSRLSGMSPD